MEETLRPIERLRHGFEFRHVFDKGTCFRTPCLRIHYLPSPRELSRMGLVVTRRTGGAVSRTRIKRLLREVYRRNKKALPEAMDIVLVAQGRARTHAEYLASFLRFAAQASASQPCAS